MALLTEIKLDTAELEKVLSVVADLAERVAKLEARQTPEIDYGALFDTHEECVAHTCSYYRHYLAYGPEDLTHEGYHAAERCLETHIKTCRIEYAQCSIHRKWEERLRA